MKKPRHYRTYRFRCNVCNAEFEQTLPLGKAPRRTCSEKCRDAAAHNSLYNATGLRGKK